MLFRSEDEDRLVLSNPTRGFLAILGLAHQIDFSNILPLYIVLLCAAPGLIVLARLDERLMLAASATVYLLARACSLNIPTWPAEGGWFFLQPVRVAIALHHWFVRRIATQGCHAFQKRGTVQRRTVRNVPRGAPALGPDRHQRIRTGARIVGWRAR